jgi:HTH-type transcriptional regulator/antitoxin MqsA
MDARTDKLPSSMIEPSTGEMLTRDVRPFTVTYRGESMVIDLPGYYPQGDGESVHVGDDLAGWDVALAELRRRADGIPAPDDIRRLRKKLKLTQRAAGALFGVGDNAFNKYERGTIQPSGPTVKLMKLLDRHPELVNDLRDPQAAE